MLRELLLAGYNIALEIFRTKSYEIIAVVWIDRSVSPLLEHKKKIYIYIYIYFSFPDGGLAIEACELYGSYYTFITVGKKKKYLLKLDLKKVFLFTTCSACRSEIKTCFI